MYLSMNFRVPSSKNYLRIMAQRNGLWARFSLCKAAGTDDYNLMQRAYYNGHYKYHGADVQHALQAHGMVYSFTCPIRNYDAMVLWSSSMITQLSILFHENVFQEAPLLNKVSILLIPGNANPADLFTKAQRSSNLTPLFGPNAILSSSILLLSQHELFPYFDGSIRHFRISKFKMI